MYAFVFGCMLVLQGANANYLFPAWRTGYQNADFDQKQTAINDTTTKPSTYSIYNLQRLNPVYWFYDNSEVDKLDQLYELVKCIIEDEADDCRQKLQISRKLFEKKTIDSKKEVLNKSTTKNDSSTTEKNDSIQNRSQVIDDQKSQVKNSTVLGEEKTTTKISNENNVITVPK